MRKDEFPIVDKVVKDSINEVLDKIRTEIEVNKKGFPPSSDYYKAITRAVNIIDKYRTESEVSDADTN